MPPTPGTPAFQRSMTRAAIGVSTIEATSERDYTELSVRAIVDRILQFQETRHGSFVMGISGTNGRARRERLKEVLRSLAQQEGINWSRVYIFLVDERWGFELVEDCNGSLVRQVFQEVHGQGGSSRLPEGHLLTPDVSMPWEQCAQDYAARLNELLAREGLSGPHLVTLGLGEDLSIASVFPEWYQASQERRAQVTARRHVALCTETTRFEVPKRVCVNLHTIWTAETVICYTARAERWEQVKEIVDGMKSRDNFVEKVQTGAFTEEEEVTSSPLALVMKYKEVTVVLLHKDMDCYHSLVVLGAAGDLAKKKTFPAIFQLFMSRVLPTNLSVIACDDPQYHKDIAGVDDLWEKRLAAYLRDQGRDSDLLEFRSLLHFSPLALGGEAGQASAAFKALDREIRERVGNRLWDNRIFYLALPPFLFHSAVAGIRQECWPPRVEGAGVVRGTEAEAGSWVRVVVEKPFGRDFQTARELASQLAEHLEERHIYRIDHYLAKTLVLNTLTLRFGNREFGRLFHADNVAVVRITFKEDIGVEGRAGYFDNYGIIRDVMQNHLLQLLTLITMEAPASLGAEDVRDEKVKVLKQIRPVRVQDAVVGQYDGYQDDPEIQRVNERRGFRSKCPTFATTILYLDNERWSGVPLVLKAGKHMEQRSTIVRLQFKKAPPNSLFGDQPQNELVIRIQPNEAIQYKILAKTPGLASMANEVTRTVLDMDLHKATYGRFPEAYEKLLHDVFHGASHNFVRGDEVEEGWRIFDPLLAALEAPDAPDPEPYEQGSRGPAASDRLISSAGFVRYTATGAPTLRA